MARSFSTRRYQLTINHPEEHGFTHDAIKALIEAGAEVVYWCMSDEIGKSGVYHTHLYIVFANAVMFTTIQKRFPGAHIETAVWGTNAENYAYVRKEGAKYNKDADGHYHYIDKKDKLHEGTNFADTFEEFGTLPPDNGHGNRNDLHLLYSLIASGADNATILAAHPEYMRDITNIDRTRQIIIESRYRDVFRKMDVTYIYGPTDVGKSRTVREKYGYAQCYCVSDYQHPFDSYQQQPVMVFEEFHSDIKINLMLQYLDGYPIELQCRYTNRQACFDKVYIISNIPIEKQYPLIQTSSPETWQAFLRRINRVRIYDLDGSHVDMTTKDYFAPKSNTIQFVPIDGCPF